jgi:hypothetical protein
VPGCSPGFWKHKFEAWPPTGYAPDDSFEAIFERTAFAGAPTLLNVLTTGGGGINALSRQATAALLNAAHPLVDPHSSADTPEEVIELWQIAFDSGLSIHIEQITNTFAALNAFACDTDDDGHPHYPPWMGDHDDDDEYDPYDNCPSHHNRYQDNYDGDDRGDHCDSDDDNDGCWDVRELMFDPWQGGGRSPRDYWDFFDVTGDLAIDVADAVAVLIHFGETPDPATGTDRYDRYSPDPSRPYRTAKATGGHIGIDVADVLVLLRSFGHYCR